MAARALPLSGSRLDTSGQPATGGPLNSCSPRPLRPAFPSSWPGIKHALAVPFWSLTPRGLGRSLPVARNGEILGRQTTPPLSDPSPAVAGALLRALVAMRDGDFSVRLPQDWVGID